LLAPPALLGSEFQDLDGQTDTNVAFISFFMIATMLDVDQMKIFYYFGACG
jgi:hypothetical protein